MNIRSKISIAMKKVAGMLNSNYKDTMKKHIAEDKAFDFMSEMKGTPAYWKRFLNDVLAMVKQLGIPSIFMTLSCANLPELPYILSQIYKLNLSDDDGIRFVR